MRATKRLFLWFESWRGESASLPSHPGVYCSSGIVRINFLTALKADNKSTRKQRDLRSSSSQPDQLISRHQKHSTTYRNLGTFISRYRN